MWFPKRKTLSFALFLTAAALFCAPPVLAGCGTPCFEDNDDMMDGQRQVMRVDDLIAVDPFPNSYSNPIQTQTNNCFLPTADLSNCPKNRPSFWTFSLTSTATRQPQRPSVFRWAFGHRVP